MDRRDIESALRFGAAKTRSASRKELFAKARKDVERRNAGYTASPAVDVKASSNAQRKGIEGVIAAIAALDKEDKFWNIILTQNKRRKSMPKPRIEKVLPERSTTDFEAVQITTAAGGEDKGTVDVVYMRPKSASVTLAWLNAHASEPLDISAFWPDGVADEDEEDETEAGETVAAFFHRYFVNSLDRKTRADAYKSLAQESTMITTGPGGEKEDIMDLPLKNLVRGINGMYAQVETRMIVVEKRAATATGVEKDKILADGRRQAEKAVRIQPWKTAAKKLLEKNSVKLAPEESGMYLQLA